MITIAARVKQVRLGEPLLFFEERADPGERTKVIQDKAALHEIERLAKLLLEHMQKSGDPQTASFEKALTEWRDRAK